MQRTRWGLAIALGAASAAAAFGLGRVTAPTHPDDLAGAIQASLGEGDALARLGRTANLLEALEPADLPDVLAVYERMIPSIERWELAAFFAAWARFDPTGAIEHALAWPRRSMLEERRIGVRAALAGWASADPLKARFAAEQIAEDHAPLRHDVWLGLVAGWVRSGRDLEGLGTFLSELRPRNQRAAAATVALRELVRAGGADAALDWAGTLLADPSQEADFKREVFEASVGAAAAADPAGTGAWTLKHAEAPYALGGPLIVAGLWGRVDGAAALGWLSAVPAGERRDKAVREAFLAWATADWDGADAWLAATALSEFHDPALEVYAEQLLAWEPAEALGGCERILDGTRRQSCLASGASRWYAKDALAAEAWLQTSSLDEEARSQVRKATAQPRSPRRRRAGG
jgi:hypothetical protein